MRIISGKWGGQTIPGKSSPKLRPTSDKVKEAIFDQLEARWIENWADIKVLDLFAGTGGFGLEALSRGAQKAIFVDHHLTTVRQIEQTCRDFEVASQVQVHCKGVLEAIRWLHQRDEKFNLIFIDPPYREDWVGATLSALQAHPLFPKAGLVIAEHDKREVITSVEAVWKLEGARRYGDTMVSFLTPKAL